MAKTYYGQQPSAMRHRCREICDASGRYLLIPALRASITLRPPRPLRGAFMRRREAGRGAVPAGLGRNRVTRAASGLRPCPLRGPARSWLTTVRSTPNAAGQLSRRALTAAGHLRRKRGPPPHNRRVWRAERRRASSQGRDTILTALFGAPSPHPEEGRRPVSKDR